MSNVAVVIGRFQNDRMHLGYEHLFQQINKLNEDRLIVFLGIPIINLSKNNPLDFNQREALVREFLQSNYQKPFIILPLLDNQSDLIWSNNLDKAISSTINYGDTITIYHGRDSFAPYYNGKFKTYEISSIANFSSTKSRETIKNAPRATQDFRAGVIYATQNAFSHARATVDIAVVKETPDGLMLLMGRKEGESGLRLPGGFVDPSDESLEHAARRELLEETGLSAESNTNVKYLGSYKLDDWRFKNIEEYSLITSLFLVKHLYGIPKASDDIIEVKWVKLINAIEQSITTHKKLVNRVYDEFYNQ